MSEKCECWILYGNEGPQSDRIERCAHCLGLEKRVEELEALKNPDVSELVTDIAELQEKLKDKDAEIELRALYTRRTEGRIAALEALLQEARTVASFREDQLTPLQLRNAELEARNAELEKLFDGAEAEATVFVNVVRKWDRERIVRFALHLLGDEHQQQIARLEAELKQRDAQLLMVRATLEEFKFGPHEKEGLKLQISNLEARNAELEAEKRALTQRVVELERERSLEEATHLVGESLDDELRQQIARLNAQQESDCELFLRELRRLEIRNAELEKLLKNPQT